MRVRRRLARLEQALNPPPAAVDVTRLSDDALMTLAGLHDALVRDGRDVTEMTPAEIDAALLAIAGRNR